MHLRLTAMPITKRTDFNKGKALPLPPLPLD
jgi:hypothetical protein